MDAPEWPWGPGSRSGRVGREHDLNGTGFRGTIGQGRGASRSRMGPGSRGRFGVNDLPGSVAKRTGLQLPRMRRETLLGYPEHLLRSWVADGGCAIARLRLGWCACRLRLLRRTAIPPKLTRGRLRPGCCAGGCVSVEGRRPCLGWCDDGRASAHALAAESRLMRWRNRVSAAYRRCLASPRTPSPEAAGGEASLRSKEI